MTAFELGIPIDRLFEQIGGALQMAAFLASLSASRTIASGAKPAGETCGPPLVLRLAPVISLRETPS